MHFTLFATLITSFKTALYCTHRIWLIGKAPSQKSMRVCFQFYGTFSFRVRLKSGARLIFPKSFFCKPRPWPSHCLLSLLQLDEWHFRCPIRASFRHQGAGFCRNTAAGGEGISRLERWSYSSSQRLQSWLSAAPLPRKSAGKDI